MCIAGCHVVAQSQHYHVVYISDSMVKSQGVGCTHKEQALCERVDLLSFFSRRLSLSFKAQCLPQIDSGLLPGILFG